MPSSQRWSVSSLPKSYTTGSDPPTLLDVSFRWWKSHFSLGMILCDVWCNIPSNILWCRKKLTENYLKKKKHFSESAAICSDFMVFVHHSFEMLWGHQENKATDLDLVQKARAGKMQIFLQAVITSSPYNSLYLLYRNKKNKHGSDYSNAFNAVACGFMAPLPLPGPESMTWRQPRMIHPLWLSHCTCNCSCWVCTQHLTSWNIDFKI